LTAKIEELQTTVKESQQKYNKTKTKLNKLEEEYTKRQKGNDSENILSLEENKM
jgi:uncharacterized coiled-coil protein SlyX